MEKGSTAIRFLKNEGAIFQLGNNHCFRFFLVENSISSAGSVVSISKINPSQLFRFRIHALDLKLFLPTLFEEKPTDLPGNREVKRVNFFENSTEFREF